MQQGRPPSSFPGRPWYTRAETRLAVVVLALLVLAAAAAVTRSTAPTSEAGVALRLPPATPAATATATSEAGAEAAATPAPTATPLLLDLRPASVGQGETMLVWVHAPGAFSVTLQIRDGSFALLPEGEIFWAVVGMPLDAPLGSDELTVTARSAGGELIEAVSESFEVVTIERPVDYITLTAEEASVLTAEAAAEERRLREMFFSAFDRGRRWSTFFRLPTQGVTTSEFGQGRSYNGGPVGGFHTGMDIAGPEGTPVLASGPARVAWVGEMPIRGISVILDHGAGVKTGYHHLSVAFVEEGEMVAVGQPIGEMGETGLATGPHLHWELTVWGVNVDPFAWTLKDFTP
ncbi:MAG: M23 family metallopeptidase [Dehalococcoidia bacterium]